jgi:NADPH-dependent glutamate synthase beta subunit-like oxidoreductase/dihydroorotate dehydrogenase/Pyruvate/2-oxoacid:ferredoxin oxidoreductase delta subunit
MNGVIKKRGTIPGDPGNTVYDLNLFLTDSQMQAELEKCEYCQEKPCMKACPCDCSPADFIKAVSVGEPSDIMRSAALIMGKNPLGGICGQTCPEKHCMDACVHDKFDSPVNIPAVQATIIEKAKQLNVMPVLVRSAPNGKKVAVIGSGPAGLGASALLTQRGYDITIFEKEKIAGGMCNLIPDFRLDKNVLKTDIEWALKLGNIQFVSGSEIDDPENLLTEGYDAIVVAAGLWISIMPGIKNENLAISGISFLQNPKDYDLSGNIAVIGGGATAFDCGMTAMIHGAENVEIYALENLSEMPLGKKEMDLLVKSGVDVNTRIRIDVIHCEDNKITGTSTSKVKLKKGKTFSLDAIETIAGSTMIRNDIDSVIIAIGAKPGIRAVNNPAIFFAGDCIEGPTTVVEASAAGKNAGEQVDAYLNKNDIPYFDKNLNGCVKSKIQIPGYNFFPVNLTTNFFGREISSPFLLSAAPPTDGFDQMQMAYEAGWPGAIMKTSFDNVPIHIPADYMFKFTENTYANCDNVSGHQLDRVCREVEKLVSLFPDRMTMASTGGPVSGDDDLDRNGWQGNTLKLENAGAMAIEYSLSCPQGGDGTEGDIVSQNAHLSQKIISWIMEIGDGNIPKIFKLTGAVTSIEAILLAIKDTFDKYPDKKAGITLANTFPTMAFRKSTSNNWDNGVIVGMAGAGALNISYLSLAKAAPIGVEISGNGGPMTYKEAANFLALGCKTVQFCSMPTKMGYNIIADLNSGLSHLMAHRRINSVQELIGIALPEPVTDFMDLSPIKKISISDHELCVRCGNCSRCPYLAVSKDKDGYPVTDPGKCIGCKMCNYLCFVGALSMRERTTDEMAVLKEN